MDERLVEQVREVIGSGREIDEPVLEGLITEIAREQGLVSDGGSFFDIEPVPEGAFKLMTVAHFPPSEAEAVFQTSGTSTGLRGRCLVRDMDLYRLSVLKGFDRFVMYEPRPHRFLSLIPSAISKPDSSLSHMASFVMEDAAAEKTCLARKGDSLDIETVAGFLGQCATAGDPVVVIGTSLDFAVLFDGLDRRTGDRLRQATGSRIMHTGGDKAGGRSLSRTDLFEGLDRRLGIPPEDVIEEFGMTELMSQAYDSPRVTPGRRRMVPVPWMMTRVLDPMTMEDVGQGEKGQLCHYDPACCHTAVALLTADVAIKVDDGFRDIRRAPGAGVRGCSHDAARHPGHER